MSGPLQPTQQQQPPTQPQASPPSQLPPRGVRVLDVNEPHAPQSSPTATPAQPLPTATAQPHFMYGAATEPGAAIDTADEPIADVVYGVSVANHAVATKNEFLRKVYGLVLLHLVLLVGFGCACLYADALSEYCQKHVDLTYLGLILLLVVFLPPFCFAALRDTAPWNALIYALFSLTTTFIFGFAVSFNNSEATLQAFVAVAITVATLMACALQTSRDIAGGWWSYALPFIVSALVLGFGRFVWPAVALGPAVAAALLSGIAGAALVYEASLLLHRLTPEQWMCAALSMTFDMPNLLIHVASLATRHTRAS